MKHIYVSPHSDDVALSCGGQIIANPGRGTDTIILNMFRSDDDDPAAAEATNGRSEFINSDRTREDEAAWASIGVQAHYAKLPEALLRGTFPMVLAGRKDDGEIVDRAFQVLVDHARSYPQATFYLPAGLGSHIDHLVCRDAGLRLIDERITDRIMLYEDTPYAWLKFLRRRYYRMIGRNIAFDADALAVAFRPEGYGLRGYMGDEAPVFPRGKKIFALIYASLLYQTAFGGGARLSGRYRGQIRPIKIGKADLAKKRDLLQLYESQIPMLFGSDPDGLLRKIHPSFSTEVLIEVSRAG